MTKIHRKILGFAIFFFVFLYAGLFCLSVNEISAAELEVEYPVIAGKTITTETKLPEYVLYLFNAGMILGICAVIVSLAIAGGMWALSPAKPDLQAEARDRVSGAISGLLILVLTYLIITTINPQLSFLKLDELPPAPPPPAEKKVPGVFLYTQSGCPEGKAEPKTSTMADLGDALRNKINSVGIVQDADTETYYIPILYDNPDLWGKCQYINPNSTCTSVGNFAASASIHVYDFKPNGGGVYFFRKPCFNKIDTPPSNINALVAHCKQNSGGWYEVKNSEIKGIFAGGKGKLEGLKFKDVPYEEQDCVKYDKNGICVARTPPSLAGENISSIIINGNYLVLLVYFNQTTDSAMSWSACQEFPRAEDANKIGPQQVKWENIRNVSGGSIIDKGSATGNVVPNYVVIIPVK